MQCLKFNSKEIWKDMCREPGSGQKCVRLCVPRPGPLVSIAADETLNIQEDILPVIFNKEGHQCFPSHILFLQCDLDALSIE